MTTHEQHQMRMCVACRERTKQEMLLRCWPAEDGSGIEWNRGMRRKGSKGRPLHGRSFYVHDKVSCIQKLMDERRIRGSLRGVALDTKKVVDFFSERLLTLV